MGLLELLKKDIQKSLEDSKKSKLEEYKEVASKVSSETQDITSAVPFGKRKNNSSI